MLDNTIVTRPGILSRDVSNYTQAQYIWSTFVANSNAGNFGSEPEGFIQYADDSATFSYNKVCRLDFYIPAGFVIKNARLQTKVTDAFNPSNVAIRITNSTIYLNPTKSTVTSSVYDYYRFSGGTSIRSAYTPSADEETVENIFTQSQIDSITIGGWNTLILQQNTNDSVGTNNAGFASFNFVVFGHLKNF